MSDKQPSATAAPLAPPRGPTTEEQVADQAAILPRKAYLHLSKMLARWDNKDKESLLAKVSELTRLLGEAEERATILAQAILALMQKHSVYLKGKAVGMSDGEAFASAVSDALQRALKGALR